MSVLEILVRKQYSTEFTLEVDLGIENGFSVLFGPSGAGKTSLLNCLAGLITPDEGRIVFHERVLFDSAKQINLPVEERRIGYVFQTLALFPHLTAAENICYGIAQKTKSEQEQSLA